jgi:hypothetical protein
MASAHCAASPHMQYAPGAFEPGRFAIGRNIAYKFGALAGRIRLQAPLVERDDLCVHGPCRKVDKTNPRQSRSHRRSNRPSGDSVRVPNPTTRTTVGCL